MQVPYFRPTIGAEEHAAVASVLGSGWLTTGEVTRRFEAEFARFVGAPHAIAVNSCTAALHLALEAAGVRAGDRVLVPTVTFAATAEVVLYLSATPVLVDCDPVTLCMDPDAAQAAAEAASREGRLKAIIPVHYGGQMADMDRLHAVAQRFGMVVVEDAAHTLPSLTRSHESSPWRSVGTTSHLTCFSFYANKCITTGEGGMVTSDDAGMAERMRLMSLHGLSRQAWNRFEAKGSWYYEIVEPGFKYNLTDIASAIGLEQLKRCNDLWQQRRRAAAQYSELLSRWADLVQVPAELENRLSAFHLYPIRLNLDALNIDRAEFIEELKRRGVTCSVHWMPLHLHPHYLRSGRYPASNFPVANAIWPSLVSLPIYPSITQAEIEYVCACIGEILESHTVETVQVCGAALRQ